MPVPEPYRSIGRNTLNKLFTLLIDAAIPVETSCTVGGGEYLDYGNAEAS